MNEYLSNSKMRDILILMRPKHYIKNLLIFIPVVFSRNLFDISSVSKVFIGFCAFSLLTSVVYIFNDINDIEADQQHEVKRTRPLASGRVNVPTAYLIAGALTIASFLCNWACKSGKNTFVIMILYFITNFGYSLGDKVR